MRTTHISAADLGTNTLKVSHFVVEPGGELRQLKEATKTVRLGYGIELTSQIEPDRMNQAIEFLQAQEAEGRRFGSDAFVGVGTDAIRIASNGKELLNRIARETSWTIQLITGEIEARLTYAGLKDKIPDTSKALIVDIGGGSTETINVTNGSVRTTQSLQIGSGRLADRYFHTDPPGIDSLLETSASAHANLSDNATLPDSIDLLLFSGGNGVFIQALVHQLFPGQPLALSTVERLIQHLATTPAADTATRLHIAHERARVLPAGAAIAFAFLSGVDAISVRGVHSGIRTGLVREHLDRR